MAVTYSTWSALLSTVGTLIILTMILMASLVVFASESWSQLRPARVRAKSTLCGEIAVSLIKQQQHIGYIALEESVKRTGLRLMTVEANKPLHLNNEIPSDAFKAAFGNTLGSGYAYLQDGFGSVDPDSLLSDIRYLVMTHEVKWIVLDHLSILLSGNESER